MIKDIKPYTDLLRSSGLRPTSQRLKICKILFDRKETFHFTIDKLKRIIEKGCKKKISVQYALVEFISILSFLIVYYLYGISLTSVLLMILSLSFIIIFFIDLKHFIIPNVLTFFMMALGFAKSFDPNLNPMFPNYINSLIGGLFGYGIIWSIIFFYKQIRKKEGMGLGDAKLFAVIGFWFGWISIPFVIFLSSVIALISVVPDLMKNSKKMSTQIPFGPYIILGTLIYVIFKNNLTSLLF